jgi:hypothetical protein
LFTLQNLEVRRVTSDEVYKDIARVPEFLRTGARGLIREGTLCKVTTNQRSAYLFLRGAGATQESIILIDDYTRGKLGVEVGETHSFEFDQAGSWGMLCWAWSATEPAYRIASRLAVVGVALGVAGLALGILSLVR